MTRGAKQSSTGHRGTFADSGGLLMAAQFAMLAGVLVAGPLWRDQWEGAPDRVAGRVLLIISAAVALPGFVALGRNLTPHPTPRPAGRLVTRGIYAVIRHPLYSSLILAGIGWSLEWRSLVALAASAVLAVVLEAKSRVEERRLLERFPEYADYARRVRKFVPWLY